MDVTIIEVTGMLILDKTVLDLADKKPKYMPRNEEITMEGITSNNVGIIQLPITLNTLSLK